MFEKALHGGVKENLARGCAAFGLRSTLPNCHLFPQSRATLHSGSDAVSPWSLALLDCPA
jgi:hypothetical protein